VPAKLAGKAICVACGALKPFTSNLPILFELSRFQRRIAVLFLESKEIEKAQSISDCAFLHLR
jgi:hypothetical protein